VQNDTSSDDTSSDTSSPTGYEQRLYATIFANSSDAIAVVDEGGGLLLANRAARALPGIDLQNLFGPSSPFEADVAYFQAQLAARGRASIEIHFPEPSGGGERRIALEGTAYGPDHVVVLRDVTEQRRLEDELRHLRRLEDLGYLTASVVHDFNNLLTAILCSTALLGKEVTGSALASELTREIRSAAERAASLTRQVLSFLRRHTSKPERVNLSAAVAEMGSLLELVLGSHVALSLELDPDVGDVVVEREQLDHVLVNLAANARDAMPRGGRVTVATSKVPVGEGRCAAPAEADPQAASPKGAADTEPRESSVGYVALTVRDDGEGMPPEIRERVFERFYTSQDAGKGTGLGLATAHRFVKRSGGCISLHSAVGQGTTVVVYLPRAVPAVPLAPAPPAAAAVPTGSEAIVVIDADDHVRGALRAVLRDRGYRVIDAPSGELALRQARHAGLRVQLVLADLASPGLPAGAVVEGLREAGRTPRLLWMSGDTDRQIAQLGALGAPLLRKAFTPAELARRVRELLDAGEPAASTGS
jgi:signal transduction histidine kinase